MNEYERFWNERLDQFERYFKDKKEKTDQQANDDIDKDSGSKD